MKHEASTELSSVEAGACPVTDVEPLALPGMDVHETLQRVGGKVWLLQSMLRSFRDIYCNAASELEQLLEQGDLEGIRGYGHKLAGAAATISAHRLTAACRLLETAAVPTDVAIHVQDFRMEMATVLAGIDALQDSKCTATLRIAPVNSAE